MGINASKSTEAQPQVPSKWSAADIPLQHDKIAIVTGANSGIGYEMALELACKGAHVVLACRNEERGLRAQADIQEALASTPQAGSVKFMRVDMGDLTSVKSFCDEFHRTYDRLDVLVNNAGIGGSTYTKTADDYEMIFATNYLGHFALTAQLLDLLKKSADARVVSVSSFLHWYGSWVFDEDKIMVNSEKEHGQLGTYSVSKLCLLLFTTELDRRLQAAGTKNITAAAAHPGYCDTKIMKKSAQNNSSWYWSLNFWVSSLFPPQSAPKGALPALYAATADGVLGGDYYGPKYLEIYGHPIRENPAQLTKSEAAAAKLWAYSEKLTHLKVNVTK
ncbi:Retinol dehydrogenase 14 [Phytophthora citrophthora]|uniref:Retinol dehydrogenase 14 n=1 Tax=Phytophthora citrophthora TaxID=4793 RepID=A0AAD9GA66_9STRA|nr:Retinol dehydrogenase 14 [Phytophthora citrophthora]